MKNFFHFLRDPHGKGLAAIYVATILIVLVGVGLLVVSPAGEVWQAVSYGFCGAMAVGTGYCVYTFILFGRRAYLRLAEENRLVHRYKYDFEWRTLVMAAGASLVSTLVVCYYGILAGMSASLWYGTLAAYYFILVLVRVGVLASRVIGKSKGEEGGTLRRRDAASYLGGGGMLILLTSVFAGMTVLMILDGYRPAYAGTTIFVAAAYVFLKIGFAIANFVRARRQDDLTVRTLRNVGISDALVSVFALQTAMLQVFEDGTGTIDSTMFNSVTAAVVCALIFAMGTVMIVRGQRAYAAEGEQAEQGGKGE